MFQKLLSKLSKELGKSKIPYVVIGGQASILYGVERLTRDIDITLGIDIDEIGRMDDLISRLGLKNLREDAEGFAKKTRVLQTIDRKTEIKIDFLFSFSPFEKEAIQRAKKIKMGGKFVNFCTVEDLIIFKMVAGREIDLFDIRNVLLLNESYNKKYVEHWLKEFEKLLNVNLLRNFNKILSTTKKK